MPFLMGKVVFSTFASLYSYVEYLQQSFKMRNVAAEIWGGGFVVQPCLLAKHLGEAKLNSSQINIAGGENNG